MARLLPVVLLWTLPPAECNVTALVEDAAGPALEPTALGYDPQPLLPVVSHPSRMAILQESR
jgi:hypothetical protein